MKMFLVTDDAWALVGMRLGGVEGALVKDEKSASAAIDRAQNDESVCVILITEGVKRMCPEKVLAAGSLARPVLCESPDSKNTDASGGSLEEYIKNAVGISI